VKEGRGGGVFIICVVGKKKQEENTLGVGFKVGFMIGHVWLWRYRI
jgi:hypothetical protein